MLETAYAQIDGNGQENMALCCDFLAYRLSLCTDVYKRQLHFCTFNTLIASADRGRVR